MGIRRISKENSDNRPDFVKTDKYYDVARSDLILMLPTIRGCRFLEIGCGTGVTLDYLKTKGASYVAGIDVNRQAIKLASRKGLDFVLAGNVEKDTLPFRPKEFDCIIMADVLEHLFDPWLTLKEVTEYLRDDGQVLLSIPNIRHYSVLRRLIFHDEWRYARAGLLDNTHIRFFTLKEIKRMLDFAGLQISVLNWRRECGKKFKVLNVLLFNNLHSFSIFQYYVLANKVR